MRKEKIFERVKSLGFIIMTDSGPIFIDDNSEFWLGGSPSVVKIAVFNKRYKAHKARNLMRHKDWFKENVNWTKIYEAYETE